MDPDRNWTIVGNRQFTSYSDQRVQYREGLFAISQELIGAGGGGTVSRSSTGSTAADSNLWTAATDIGIDTAGNGAWMTGQLGAMYGSSALYFILATDEASSSLTPRNIQARYSTQPYTGGTTSALPTTVGTQTNLPSSRRILSWTTPVHGRYATWRSTQGDVIYLSKGEDQAWWGAMFMLLAFTKTFEVGEEFVGFAFRQDSAALTSSNKFLTAIAGATPRWESLDSRDAFSIHVRAGSRIIEANPSLPRGASLQGEAESDPVAFFKDGTNANQVLGVHKDIQTSLASLPFGAVDPRENGATIRRVNMGSLVLFWPAAALPIV